MPLSALGLVVLAVLIHASWNIAGASVRSVSMLFVALLGGHLPGEGDGVARLAGAASIGVGVVALSWS